MPSNNITRVKNRIKQNLLQVGQLIEEGDHNAECMLLLNESLRNLMRIRSRLKEDKFEVVKNSIEQLMNICVIPVENTYEFCAERTKEGMYI